MVTLGPHQWPIPQGPSLGGLSLYIADSPRVPASPLDLALSQPCDLGFLQYPPRDREN